MLSGKKLNCWMWLKHIRMVLGLFLEAFGHWVLFFGRLSVYSWLVGLGVPTPLWSLAFLVRPAKSMRYSTTALKKMGVGEDVQECPPLHIRSAVQSRSLYIT